jgi:hypothetical protein
MKKLIFFLLFASISFASSAQTADTTLHGSLISKAPEATSVSFTWSQVSGPVTAVFSDVHALQPVVSKLPMGHYVFQLVGVDNFGVASTPSQVQVDVTGSGTKPVVYAGDNFILKLGSK